MIKYETNSAPNSPKSGRFSPRKTHITNFINQNVTPPSIPPPITSSPIELTTRKNNLSSTSSDIIGHQKLQSQIQLNKNSLKSASNSPSIRRRIRSQSPRITIDSDSDTDDDQNKKSSTSTLRNTNQHHIQKFDIINNDNHHSNSKTEINDKILSKKVHQKIRDLKDDLNNKNLELSLQKMSLYDELDYENHNNIIDTKKPSLISFRSIDMGNKNSINVSYCPQSEPLKRKIYKGSSSFERLKKSLDMESGKFFFLTFFIYHWIIN